MREPENANRLEFSIGRGPGILAVGFHTALLVGLIEWWVVGRGGFGLFQGEALRSLAAVILLYGGAGVASGVLVVAAQYFGAAPSTSWVIPVGVLLALAALRGADGLFSLLGALSLLAVVTVLGTRRGGSLDGAVRGFVPPAVAVGLGVALAISSLGARDSSRWAWALVAAVLVAGLGVVAVSGRQGRRAVLCGVAVAVALAVAVVAGVGPPTADPDSTPSDQPAVLLVTIDTLRADAVGAYGHEQARTPNLDGLIRQSLLFENVVAPTVWTGPSHASIFTGLVPERHGVLLNASRLEPDVRTIVESVREEGFVTASFNGGYTTSESSLGLPGRFHFFDDDMRNMRWLPPRASELTLVHAATSVVSRLGVDVGYAWPGYRSAGSIVDAAGRWLGRNGDRPWFVWVHLFDPHLPYRPPAELVPEPGPGSEDVSGAFYGLSADKRLQIIQSDAATARMLQLYDAEIAYADRELGRLLAMARDAAPTAGLVTVVTSDHGEAMGEHGLYWNRDLHDESLRVPLAITGPRVGPKTHRVADQVQLIDLAPTILQLLDLDVPDDLDGTSLVPWLLGQDPPASNPAISVIYQQFNDFHRPSASVRLNEWKLIQTSEGWLGGRLGPTVDASQQLYDLVLDPRELVNLGASRTERLEELSLLLATRKRPESISTESLTPEQQRMLRSLGYLR